MLDVNTVFQFNASQSVDPEDGTSGLLYRWDWENDGLWDTNYSSNPIITHQFTQAGNYSVLLDVSDKEGLFDTHIVSVNVTEPVTTEGLIAYYPFTGGYADDESGNWC